MKIEKALKRQRKYNKVFIILMFFLAIFLPIITYLAYVNTFTILVFLTIIEILIFIAIIMKINNSKLKFVCKNNKLKFISGIFSSYTYIQCNKVALVHTNKSDEEMEIILVTTRIKNKKNKIITRSFQKKYKDIEEDYIRLTKINRDTKYYFEVIKYGELKKYILLDIIYKNCVNAIYTTSAIENIKIARGQKEI